MINQNSNIRVGDVIISDKNPITPNLVSSGFKVTEILANGLKVQRIHTIYLFDNPIESWIARWDQLINFSPIPYGTQFPLL